MAGLNKDDLHLTRLTVQAPLFSQPQPGQALTPQALSAKDGSAIYGEIARFGFSSFQMIPGGVLIASADGVSVLNLTGAGWSFTEDLSRSAWQLAAEKMAVSLEVFTSRLPPGTFMLNQMIDLQAVWENLGEPADSYIAKRFLKEQVAQVGSGLPGLQFNGGAIRISLIRPSTDPLPGPVSMTGPKQEGFDVRIEPLFQDKTKLFIQLTANFLPTAEVRVVSERLEFVRTLLWDHLAGNIVLDSGGTKEEPR